MTCGRFVAVAAFGLTTACRTDQAARDQFFADAMRKQQDKQEQAATEAREHRPPSIMDAAQYGDVKQMEAALADGADQKLLNTALLEVSHSLPLVVDVNRREVDLSPRYVATARLLLEKGANLEARDEQGFTPLLFAASYGGTAMVKLFLEKGAKIEARNSSGQTALIGAACNCMSIDMPSTGDAARLLLAHGADLEARDKKGETALMAAAEWGRVRIVEILLDKGAWIEARDNKGNTALLIGAHGGGYPTADGVQMLLDRGASVKARNNNGETALMLAASHDGSEAVEIVKILLSHGADARPRDLKGRTALDMAAGWGREEVLLLKSAMH
jgi:ankyrin repeat protein